MDKQLRLLPYILLICLSLLSISCQPEEVDEAALVAVNDYIENATALILELHPDLLGWVRQPYSDNLPLVYDGERREWLQEHQENLLAIRQAPLDDIFPSAEIISRWKVVVVRGEQEWLLEGPALVDSLTSLEELIDEIIEIINLIVDHNGELDMLQSNRVLSLVDKIEPEVEEIRAVLFH